MKWAREENEDTCIMRNFHFVIPVNMTRIIKSGRVKFHVRCEKLLENCRRKKHEIKMSLGRPKLR